MAALVRAGLLVAGVIHLLPVTGAWGGPRLAALYGVSVDDRDLILLLRHRAVLLGILGALLCTAAFEPPLQRPALLAGGVSVLAFLGFARPVRHYRAPVRRVVRADWIALAGLALAAAGRLALHHPGV